MLDSARKLSKIYINRIKDVDLHKGFRINGVNLNCPLWIIAHIAWAEFYLVLETTKGQSTISWLNNFQFGSSAEPQKDWPKFEEIELSMDIIHTESLTLIKNMTNEDLNAKFLNDSFKNRKEAIFHAIRHEAQHAGHLSWLCKLNNL